MAAVGQTHFQDLYKVDFIIEYSGGELIEVYNYGGVTECEKLIRSQFGQLMYQDGKGQIINRSEYLRWKFRDHEQVS